MSSSKCARLKRSSFEMKEKKPLWRVRITLWSSPSARWRLPTKRTRRTVTRSPSSTWKTTSTWLFSIRRSR